MIGDRSLFAGGAIAKILASFTLTQKPEGVASSLLSLTLSVTRRNGLEAG
ncbi:hypothetical protein [Coleofasciculus sp.]